MLFTTPDVVWSRATHISHRTPFCRDRVRLSLDLIRLWVWIWIGAWDVIFSPLIPVEEIDKKLTAYRRGSKFWRMLIFCQVSGSEEERGGQHGACHMAGPH